ncbi:oxygenase MpaB family protein [Pseudarthrobacter sp. PS3-L1]|uniref:oxygenase MpaB family protein n=1 Tax=Pseudarthrobacter sp. PS3-L1 TaxID=3046207 RepID=UPI0024B88A60|nr:oxygenase MpaB family protein [Pseudarthrobacter sp. PS3-L1]MDJ0318994.1 oxygenase MpaB family protein [Pseudarthrobacter sp. PS3-L1]
MADRSIPRPADLALRVRRAFRARVSGDPTGAPDWVRDIAQVGEGPGWFEPDGVVWRVHGDLSTLVGGVAALLGQGAHPLAMAGVSRHSSYRSDPWARLAGTARWLTVSTFGSAELAERDSARVRGMHGRVRGTTDDGRAYAASDPALLRWVHLAFTDAFLGAHEAVGHDLVPQFGRNWADTYVADWSRSARALGAEDLPTNRRELAEALRALEPTLEPVPAELLTFLAAPDGLNRAEKIFYNGLAGAGALVLSPSVAPFAGVPGRGDRSAAARLRLQRTRLQLRAFQLALGPYSPSEDAARYRVGLAGRPDWLD